MANYNDLNNGDLNPKVQIELEKLNSTSSQINEFENKLQNLRNSFNDTLTRCSSNLVEMSSKIESSIFRARPYFESKWSQIEIQRESQRAASRYETSCADLSDAIGAVNKIEALAKETSRLDDSTMEVLNTAISKVNLAKKEKTEAHIEHQNYLSIYMNLDQKIRSLEKRYKNDIKKSSDYFTFTKNMDAKLKEEKLIIEAYEEKIRICKSLYNESLQRLEQISNQIHKERQSKEQLGPRGEGVGSEMHSENTIEHCFEPLKLNCNSLTEINEHTDSPEIDFSVSSTISAHTSHNYDCISEPGSRRCKLISSTPIIDGLLKSALYNQRLFPYQTSRQFSQTLPNDAYNSSATINSESSSILNNAAQMASIDETGDNL